MKSELKATRGPWKAIKAKWGIQGDEETLICNIVVDSPDGDRDLQVVAETAPYSLFGAPESEWYPNAHLIAAAPDLYAACFCEEMGDGDDYRVMAEWCRKEYSELYAKSAIGGGIVPDRVRYVARMLRRAALAKARGEGQS